MDDEVRAKFDEIAQGYDRQRRKLIPCFDDFYGIAASLADVPTDNPSILDLGGGTGLLSSLLLQKYPQAHMTIVDISDKMLEMAKSRLGSYAHVEYVQDDYSRLAAPGAFDLIVSALSIHHLPDSDKSGLYRNTYLNLKNGGVFVNADQVQGYTPYLDDLYRRDWERKIEASGLSEQEIQSAYERTKLDRMAPLAVQLDWMREAGFQEVDCVYKYYNFVVMYGRKSA